jgi:hypothetical protein
MYIASKITVLPTLSKTRIDTWQSEYDETHIRVLPRPEDVETAGKMHITSTDLNSYTVAKGSKPQEAENINNERELIRKQLLDAGFLVTSILTPEDEENRILSPEEIAIIGKLPPHARTIQEILDEDRGEY